MNAEKNLYYTVYNLLDALWRRRFFFAVSVIGMPILALIAGFFVPKHYEAETSIATYSSTPPFMKDVSFLPDIEEQFSSLNTYISSPGVLRSVAIQTGMMTANTDQQTQQGIINDLSKSIQITLVEKNVVKIKLIRDNPQNMIAILNSLSDVFINQFISPLTASTKSAANYLKNEVISQKKKLKDSVDALARFEEENALFMPAYESIYFARLRQIITDLGSKNSEYKGALSEERELKQSLLKVNPILGNLDNAIADNDVKIDKMRLVYTDNYSGIKSALEMGKSLRAQRDELYQKYQNINEENLQQLWNMALASSSSGSGKQTRQLLASQLEDYQKLKIKQKGLEQELSSLAEQQKDITEKLNKVTLIKKQLLPLKQVAAENQDLYQDLLKRYNMTNLTSYLNNFDKLSNVKIIAYPQIKITGRPFLFYPLAGIVGGLFLGFGISLLLELVDNTARKKLDIEEITGVMVISRIGNMSHG